MIIHTLVISKLYFQSTQKMKEKYCSSNFTYSTYYYFVERATSLFKEAKAWPLQEAAILFAQRPKANNDKVLCQFLCIIEKDFICGFAVIKVESGDCLLGPAIEGNVTVFHSDDITYVKPGILFFFCLMDGS